MSWKLLCEFEIFFFFYYIEMGCDVVLDGLGVKKGKLNVMVE